MILGSGLGNLSRKASGFFPWTSCSQPGLRNGTCFTLDGRIFCINGWNSYYLMDHAVDEYTRPKVTAMLQARSKIGLTVCRTWAFNDGRYNSLQISPGQYDDHVFKVFARGVDADTVVLMATRASRVENKDAIDTPIVGTLADLKEARAGIQEVHVLPFNPTDKRTALAYIELPNN